MFAVMLDDPKNYVEATSDLSAVAIWEPPVADAAHKAEVAKASAVEQQLETKEGMKENGEGKGNPEAGKVG